MSRKFLMSRPMIWLSCRLSAVGYRLQYLHRKQVEIVFEDLQDDAEEAVHRA